MNHAVATVSPPSAELPAPPVADVAQVEHDSSPDARSTPLESIGPYLASLVVHLALFLLLALSFGGGPRERGGARGVLVVGGDELADDTAFGFDAGGGSGFEAAEAPMLESSDLDPPDVVAESDPRTIERELRRGDPADAAVRSTDASAMARSTKGAAASRRADGLDGAAGLRGAGSVATGFANRGNQARQAALSDLGGTPETERAVDLALGWLARHQASDGSWSLDRFGRRCQHGWCSGPALVESDVAGTALGLLPFLGAGQTHQTKGRHQEAIRRAIWWLMRRQDASGNLATNSQQVMYSHGLATIALCEAFGMTQDPRIGYAAQAAVDFIQRHQSPALGGWRYTPGDGSSDTSVVGWQLMALKSAQMAKLQVSPRTLEGVEKWLRSVSSGQYGGFFAYQPGQRPSPTMTAVGLLCRQYLGAARDDASLGEGAKHLLENPPAVGERHDIYYWYYATQVLHNLQGDDWKKWNLKMRQVLVDTQVRKGCGAGSWDPAKPHRDIWGERGGRLMVTSLSCLTLEVYYRYLPLYSLDQLDDAAP